jgi:hypothetical protein
MSPVWSQRLGTAGAPGWGVMEAWAAALLGARVLDRAPSEA